MPTEPTVTRSLSKHTPGPWTCDVVVDDVRPRDGGAIQPTYAINVKGHAWPIVQGDEAHANARLIAAAPELLNLARQYLLDMRFPVFADDARRRRAEAVEAVVAKIEGRS